MVTATTIMVLPTAAKTGCKHKKPWNAKNVRLQMIHFHCLVWFQFAHTGTFFKKCACLLCTNLAVSDALSCEVIVRTSPVNYAIEHIQPPTNQLCSLCETVDMQHLKPNYDPHLPAFHLELPRRLLFRREAIVVQMNAGRSSRITIPLPRTDIAVLEPWPVYKNAAVPSYLPVWHLICRVLHCRIFYFLKFWG